MTAISKDSQKSLVLGLGGKLLKAALYLEFPGNLREFSGNYS
jgi:hypothetical protein